MKICTETIRFEEMREGNAHMFYEEIFKDNQYIGAKHYRYYKGISQKEKEVFFFGTDKPIPDGWIADEGEDEGWWFVKSYSLDEMIDKYNRLHNTEQQLSLF